jgi:acyl-CoA synthetase (AMP-forming)/AMP-acid ligase II
MRILILKLSLLYQPQVRNNFLLFREVSKHDVGPKLLFTTLRSSKYDYRPCLMQLERRIPSLRKIILLHDTSGVYPHQKDSPFFDSLSSLLKLGRSQNVDWQPLEKTLSDTDILNLQFTSGSTGAPKAAALTHHSMINCARYIGMKMDIRREDKVVIPVPLFHAFGLIIGMLVPMFGRKHLLMVFIGICTNIAQGAATVLPSEYFDAGLTLHAVEKYHCTGLYGVTTMFIDQLSHPNFSNTKRSSLR